MARETRRYRQLREPFALSLALLVGLVWVHQPSRYYFFGDSWGLLHSLLISPKMIFDPWNEQFMPIFKALYFLQYRLFGPHHLAYELVLLALHAFNATLVYVLARRFSLRFWPSISASLFFAFSSVTWEVTGWSFEQCFALGALFMLTAIIIYWENPIRTPKLLSVAWLSLAALWSGPISLALPAILSGSYWLWTGKERETGTRRDAARNLAAIWVPALVYFASLRATRKFAAVLAIQHTRLTLTRIPEMINFTLFGINYGLVLPTLTFFNAPSRASSGAILLLLFGILVYSYRALTSQAQRKAFWFLLWMTFASFFTISIGRSQLGVGVALSPRYLYFPAAGLALLIALSWQACRDTAFNRRPPVLINTVGLILMGYLLGIHVRMIRKANPAAERGLLTQQFLPVAKRATFPGHADPSAVVLGPELPVPLYVCAPGYMSLWMVFQVLAENLRAVVPVGDYLRKSEVLSQFNFIRDGGFETPIGGEWLTYGGVHFSQTVAAAHSGKLGVDLVLPQPHGAFSQDVISGCSRHLPGKIFTFAIYAKTSGGDALRARVIFKGQGGAILGAFDSQPHPGDNEWRQLVVGGLATPGTCIVGVDVTNEGDKGLDAMVDDALLVLHPGTVDAGGKVTFEMPDTFKAQH